MTARGTPGPGASLEARIASLPPDARAELRRRLSLGDAAGAEEPIARRRLQRAPLSLGQERLWLMHQLVPSNALYHLLVDVHLGADLSPVVLRRVLHQMVRRHEVLRTAVVELDGVPAQVVHDDCVPPVTVEDLRGLAPADRREALDRVLRAQSAAPFDLTVAPLFRVCLVRLGPRECVVAVHLHHLVADGETLRLFRAELLERCNAALAGRAPAESPLHLQYADFASWQRARFTGLDDPDLAYWVARLRDAPVLDLPVDHLRRAGARLDTRSHSFVIDGPAVTALRQLCRAERATTFMVLLALYAQVLGQYARATDLVVGCPTSGRHRAEVSRMLGFFVDWLPLRVDLGGSPTVRELIRRVRASATDGYEHQDVPFERIASHLGVTGDPTRHPVFQAMFQVLPGEPSVASGDQQGGDGDADHRAGAGQLDVALTVWELPDQLSCRLDHRIDLYVPDTAARLATSFSCLVAQAVREPDRVIDDLSLVPPDRFEAMLADGEGPAEPFDDAPVHHQIAGWARRDPDAPAARYHGVELSYDELVARAGRLVAALCARGVSRGDVVGVCTAAGFDLLVAVLGVVGSGAAYLPLDPAYPRRRLSWMTEDAGTRFVVVDGVGRHAMGAGPDPRVAVVDLAELTDLDRTAGVDGAPPPPSVAATDRVYVMYTSGSTGQPKAVPVTHGNLANLVAAQQALFDVRPGTRSLQFASPSFDASVSEIFVALCSGATLCLADRQELHPGEPLHDHLRHERIELATLPPSVLAATPSDGLDALRCITAAGEPCPPELVRRWQPGRRFLNLYGPTETTVCATAAACAADDERVVIGRPIANVQVVLLNERFVPVPDGAVGEVFVGGAGVTAGYLGRPELTRQRFVPGLLGGRYGVLYRTGDLARRLPSGAIEYLGRTDRQVKLRGFRIEPGEIEDVLLAHPAVADAVVVVTTRRRPDGELFAFVTAGAGAGAGAGEVDRRSLFAFAAEHLPAHMVPTGLTVLPAVPRTPNGKVDHAALVAGLTAPRPLDGVSRLTPSEAVVARVWGEVLGLDHDIERAGAEANFFDLGGDSLLLVKVQRSLEAVTGTSIPLLELYRRPSLYALAPLVGGHEPAERALGVG